MSAKNEHGLTPPMERFAQLVGAAGENLATAYRTAYPTSKAWKDSSVYPKASALASNGKVAARIKELQAANAQAAGLDSVKVLEELRRIAHSDIVGIMTPDGKVKLPHELDPVTRAAVRSFKIDEYGRLEYTFWDKKGALDMAMKHLGLYEKDNAQQPPPLIGEVRLVALQPEKPVKPIKGKT